jgi:hypothetical protein
LEVRASEFAVGDARVRTVSFNDSRFETLVAIDHADDARDLVLGVPLSQIGELVYDGDYFIELAGKTSSLTSEEFVSHVARKSRRGEIITELYVDDLRANVRAPLANISGATTQRGFVELIRELDSHEAYRSSLDVLFDVSPEISTYDDLYCVGRGLEQQILDAEQKSRQLAESASSWKLGMFDYVKAQWDKVVAVGLAGMLFSAGWYLADGLDDGVINGSFLEQDFYEASAIAEADSDASDMDLTRSDDGQEDVEHYNFYELGEFSDDSDFSSDISEEYIIWEKELDVVAVMERDSDEVQEIDGRHADLYKSELATVGDSGVDIHDLETGIITRDVIAGGEDPKLSEEHVAGWIISDDSVGDLVVSDKETGEPVVEDFPGRVSNHYFVLNDRIFYSAEESRGEVIAAREIPGGEKEVWVDEDNFLQDATEDGMYYCTFKKGEWGEKIWIDHIWDFDTDESAIMEASEILRQYPLFNDGPYYLSGEERDGECFLYKCDFNGGKELMASTTLGIDEILAAEGDSVLLRDGDDVILMDPDTHDFPLVDEWDREEPEPDPVTFDAEDFSVAEVANYYDYSSREEFIGAVLNQLDTWFSRGSYKYYINSDLTITIEGAAGNIDTLELLLESEEYETDFGPYKLEKTLDCGAAKVEADDAIFEAKVTASIPPLFAKAAWEYIDNHVTPNMDVGTILASGRTQDLPDLYVTGFRINGKDVINFDKQLTEITGGGARYYIGDIETYNIPVAADTVIFCSPGDILVEYLDGRQAGSLYEDGARTELDGIANAFHSDPTKSPEFVVLFDPASKYNIKVQGTGEGDYKLIVSGESSLFKTGSTLDGKIENFLVGEEAVSNDGNDSGGRRVQEGGAGWAGPVAAVAAGLAALGVCAVVYRVGKNQGATKSKGGQYLTGAQLEKLYQKLSSGANKERLLRYWHERGEKLTVDELNDLPAAMSLYARDYGIKTNKAASPEAIFDWLDYYCADDDADDFEEGWVDDEDGAVRDEEEAWYDDDDEWFDDSGEDDWLE